MDYIVVWYTGNIKHVKYFYGIESERKVKRFAKTKKNSTIRYVSDDLY